MKYILIFLLFFSQVSFAQNKVVITGGAGGAETDPVVKAVNGIVQSNGTTISAAAQTGTGSVVLATSPLLVTPRLAATSTLNYVWTATDASGNGSFQVAAGGAGGTTWNGNIGGSSSPSGNATFPGGSDNVQYISNNTAPATFTLPNLSTNLNKLYFIKNEGTSLLTVQRAGSDTMFTDSKVFSITIPVGESRLIGSGGISYWHVHGLPSAGGGSGDMILASIQTVTGAKTFNSGKLIAAGATSGTSTLNAPAIAGTTTVTLPPVTSDIVSYKSGSTTSNSTITASGDAWINTYKVTALAVNPTFAAPSGTYIDGCTVMYSVKDDGTPHTFTWDTIFRGGSTLSLPTGTTTSKWIKIQFMYNSTDNKFDLTGIVDGI